MEFVTVKLIKSEFELSLVSDVFTFYKLKSVEEKDLLFENDNHYKELKKASFKAYEDLKIYEFKKRHKII